MNVFFGWTAAKAAFDAFLWCVYRLLADYIRKTINNNSSDPVVDSSSTAERFVTRLGRCAAAGRRRHFVVAFTT